MQIQFAVAALMTAGLITGVTSTASAQTADAKVGSSVTITSCVVPGQTDNTYVLTDLSATPAVPATYGKVIYWLGKPSLLRGHAGHQITFTGVITDVDRREIEVKLDQPGGVIEIEGPGNQVKVAPEYAGLSIAGQTLPERAVPTTLVKLKVDRVQMTSDNCAAVRATR